jgi:hypothetical protein
VNNLIPVPRVLVEEILGNLPGDVDTAACGVIYGTICELGNEVTEVPLTPSQVGELFKLAWADVEDGFTMDSAIPNTSPLSYVMSGSIESEERLRDLVLWASKGLPKHHTMERPKLLTATRYGEGCFTLTRKGPEVLVAQVTLQPASMIPPQEAFWSASFTGERLNEAELREISDVLGILNEQIGFTFGGGFRL